MIPAVEGLLPEPYNGLLLTLLYRLAEWHALAKLRMHTEYTLGELDKATVTIGHELRAFHEWTGAAFTCKELPQETDRQGREKERKQKKHGSKKNSAGSPTTKSKSAKAKVKNKFFNLSIYKFHALGDYVRTIRLFGTTDSYSTQIVRPKLSPIIKLTFLWLLSGRTSSSHGETPVLSH